MWMQLEDLEDRSRLDPLLSYEQVWWQQGPRGKVRKSRRVPMITRKGYLYSGFLPYLRERFAVDLSGQTPMEGAARLTSIDLRPYQQGALAAVLICWRGQISLPTGTGKTVLAASVLDSLEDRKALFVVHTKDLLYQTKTEFERLLGEGIGCIGDSEYELRRITVGMIQSVRELQFDDLDVVMIDECHHSASPTYQSFLASVDCPVRLGFTATPRTDREGWLKSMGLLGAPAT